MLDPKHNRPKIRITGLGACMIGGYPHDTGSFYDLACEDIAARCDVEVQRHVHSLGGFPAPRAAKYLAKKVLPEKPDYVVIQLASLDALCPVRKGPSSSARGSSFDGPSAVQVKSASLTSRMRWLVASVLGVVLHLEPTTPLPQLLEVMDFMIQQCLDQRATPVIIGPFVYGSMYSMRNGLRYADALRTLAAKRAGAIFVDATPSLRRFSKTRTLQADGFHLSKLGHALVAEQVASAVARDINAKQATL